MANLKSKIDSVITKALPHLFPHWSTLLKKDLAGCQTVLDLGCGPCSVLKSCGVPFSIGVDDYEPYLVESQRNRIHTDYIKGDLRQLEITPKAFDAVILLAVLEHLDKEEAYDLMRKMEIWARKKVILTTTNGFLGQDDFDGNSLQIHKSGWSVKDLERQGYKVNGMNGWKPLRGYRGQVRIKPVFWGNVIAETTQYLTYHIPELSFILYGVKEL